MTDATRAEADAAPDFFERARRRLSLAVPAALTDPDAPAIRGDLDLDPEAWKKAGVIASRPAAVLVAVVALPVPVVILTQRTTDTHEPRRPDRLSGRQDRSARRQPGRGGAARGRGVFRVSEIGRRDQISLATG